MNPAPFDCRLTPDLLIEHYSETPTIQGGEYRRAGSGFLIAGGVHGLSKKKQLPRPLRRLGLAALRAAAGLPSD
jgi:hypothetical protein